MNKNVWILILVSITGVTLGAQIDPRTFFGMHQDYIEPSIATKRFKHQDIERILAILRMDPRFEVKPVGKSFLGRTIYLVRIGQGAKKVLLWSQMHGDESTATMALLDIFNYLKHEEKEPGTRKRLLEECTLYFIPMLNPDGAELFVRRNAQQIDINRDAVFLQSPEARLLKSIRDSLNPEFGFNLHDQSKYYTAGDTKRPASISLLAPAYNVEKEVNGVRNRAMLLIAQLQLALQAVIPNGVGRYDDEFEPRAFGDNIQKWGTSTILIETGAFENDPEKQFLRKVNFMAILTCLQSISENSYTRYDLKDYWSIPENKTRLNDLVIRNITLEQNQVEYRSDVSINISEAGGRAAIADMGDLSVFRGYKEWDGSGKKMVPGKVYPMVFKNMKKLGKVDPNGLLAQGFTEVRLKKLPKVVVPGTNPLNIIGEKEIKSNVLAPGANPNALIFQNGVLVARLVNGAILPVNP